MRHSFFANLLRACALALAAALMLFFLLGWLKAVMREKNIH